MLLTSKSEVPLKFGKLSIAQMVSVADVSPDSYDGPRFWNLKFKRASTGGTHGFWDFGGSDSQTQTF